MPRPPRVDKLPLDMTLKAPSARGEWYVARDTTNEWGEDHIEYLHADGVWRGSTFSGENWGSPTGYFASENDARAALVNATTLQR